MDIKLPGEWEWQRIGDLKGSDGLLIDGDWILSNDMDADGEVRLVQLADIGEGYFLDKSMKHITKEKAEELSCTYLKVGDILISRLSDPLMKACILPNLTYPSITAVDVTILRPNSHRYDPRYLCYAINSSWMKAQASRLAAGTTRERISRKNMESLIVPIPPLETQRKIVAVLDKAEETKRLRFRAKELTQKLLQSVFLEMFGDPAGNKMGWDTKHLFELCSKITDGKHGDCRNEKGSGYYFISAKDIMDGRIDYSNARQIKLEDFLEVNRRIELEPGNILITNSGTIGKVAVVRDDREAKKTTFQKSVAIVRNNPKSVDSIYLQYYLEFSRNNLVRQSSGSSQKNLLLRDISSFIISVPPLSNQHKFASIVNMVEMVRGTQQKSLEENEALSDVISTKAFRGELFAEAG